MAGTILTIGMAAYNNPREVRYTLLGLTMDHKTAVVTEGDVEIIVVDNYGCNITQAICQSIPGVRYILSKDIQGTAHPRDLLFREAKGRFTCCIDSHIKIESDPRRVAQLKDYLRANMDSIDLLQGPLITESGGVMWTEFRDSWGAGMWGQGHARAIENDEPFDIFAQGLGLFCCRTEVFLSLGGFNPNFRGFGGEEVYLHEKFRKAGGRCLCLPWLRWWHDFKFQSETPPYPALRLDMFKNYLYGCKEVGLDAMPVIQHYINRITPSKMREAIVEVYDEADGDGVAGSSAGDRESGDADRGTRTASGPQDAGETKLPAQHEEPYARPHQRDGRGLGGDALDRLPGVRAEVHDGGRQEPDHRVDQAADANRLPFVSCLCMTYGRCPKWQHLIEEAIESFVRQSYPAQHRELVILNDCAEQKLECHVPGVKVINVAERFPSLGDKLNHLVECAAGDVLIPWDDDDISLRDRLSQAVDMIGHTDWWNPRGSWFLAETPAGPEGSGLHHEHSHGYCTNASAFTRRGWEKIGRFPSVGAVDKFTEALLHLVKVAPALPPKRPDLWQFIYRWGVSPCHMSGGGDCDRSYLLQGHKKNRVGTFVLKPQWRRDYQKLIEFQLEEIDRHANAVRAQGHLS